MSVPAFRPEELAYDREFASITPRFTTAKHHPNTPITQKENFLRNLHHDNPLWIPHFGDWYCFVPDVVPDTVAKGLVLQYEPFDPKNYGGPDIFGIPWVYEPSAGGSMPVAKRKLLEDVNDWREFVTIPDVDSWDWEGAREKNKDFLIDDMPRQYWFFTGFFERMISFMDFQNAAIALIDEDQADAIHDLFNELANLYDNILDHLQKYLGVDYIIFHDDAGTQRDSFYSTKVHREFIVPYITRVVESCHKRGIIMELHSCGKNDRLIEGVVETGVDIWTPQCICDTQMFYEKYGDKMVFALDSDLPNMNPMTPEADAIASAKRFVAKYGPHIEEKPVISASWAAPQVYHEVIYEESRKLLGG